MQSYITRLFQVGSSRINPLINQNRSFYFLIAVSIVIISLSIFFLPARLSTIICGLLALIIGSVALTEEWKKGKRIRAVIFTVSITVGGLLTTQGWNLFDEHFRKKAMVLSIATEWRLNDLHNEVISSYSQKLKKSNFSNFTPFPLLQNAQLKTAMASGLFLGNRDEIEHLKTVLNYSIIIDAVNARLDHLNRTYLLPFDTKQRETQFNFVFDESRFYSLFLERQQNMKTMFEEDFNWVFRKLHKADLTITYDIKRHHDHS